MKRGRFLSFLVGTISNVLVMEIGWTDVGSGGYILVSCAHSNTSSPWDPVNKDEFDQSEMFKAGLHCKFVTNRQRNAFIVGDMLQHFNWCSLENRCIKYQKILLQKADLSHP